jgi:hypothetical protein
VTTVERPSGTATARRSQVFPIVAYLAVATTLTVVQYAFTTGGRTRAGVWIRYDGGAYLTIAREGYSWSAADPYPLTAWFPGFPLGIRAVEALVGDFVLAGVVLSFACGLASAVLFWRWMERLGMGEAQRRLGIAILLLYGWAWYLYGVVYGDGLYLALTLGAFLLAERRHVLGATVLAAVATTIRPTAVVLVLGVLVLVTERDGVLGWAGWERRGRRGSPVRVRWERVRPVHALPLLSLAGIAAFSVQQGIAWGRPLLWLEAQQKWNQGPSAGPASWLKLHMIARIVRVHDPAYIAKCLGQGAVVVAVTLAIPAVLRRVGLGYAVYVGALVAFVALGANDFVGCGRYLLGAFPAAAVLAERLRGRRWQAAAWLAVSASLLVAQTALFARDVYLS